MTERNTDTDHHQNLNNLAELPEPSASGDAAHSHSQEDTKQPASASVAALPKQQPVFDENASGFPQKLMEILNDETNHGIICWLPHGKGFEIRNKARFADFILPKYFKKSKFTSFTRKLNRWNFTRVTRGPETGAYYHPLFVRDNPRLCLQMSCINSKTAQTIQPMDPVALGLGTYMVPGVPGAVPVFDNKDAMAALAAFQQNQYMMFMAQQQAAAAAMQQQQQIHPQPSLEATTAASTTTAATEGSVPEPPPVDHPTEQGQGSDNGDHHDHIEQQQHHHHHTEPV